MAWTPEDDIIFNQNEAYWKDRLKNQPVFKKASPRSPLERFLNNVDEFIRHDSPAAAIARRITPYIPTIERDYGDERPIEQRRGEVKSRITQKEREHREVRAQYDPADSIGDYASDFAGTMVGSMISDPTTYVGGVGKNVGEKIINMMGMNALADAAQQGAEVQEGVRDEYDPYQGAFNVALPGVLGGAVHLGSRVNAGRKIRAGSKDPEYGQLVDTILGLEGGGTLTAPKRSPKGALGPMQVMPETARDPGFGIRPWNGKSQADLARVGRQYAAALNHKYGGDKAKVLAAYNAGPGRVDGLVAKYGDEWRAHLPRETKAYVRNGLGKLGKETGPEDLGEVRLVQDEQPDPLIQQTINDALAPREEVDTNLADDLIARGSDSDNVVDFPEDPFADLRRTKAETHQKYKDLENQYDEALSRPYEQADFDLEESLAKQKEEALDAAIKAEVEYKSAVEKASGKKNLLDIANELTDRINNLTPAERQDMDASVTPGDVPRLDSSHEKFTPYVERPNEPANDPKRTLGGLLRDLIDDESGALKGDNDNVHNIADARQKKELGEFHKRLMSDVHNLAQATRQLAQRYKEEGLFKYEVGDRFSTSKSRELGAGPWKVTGYFVDPKKPDRYGYYVERGSEQGDDLERSVMLLSDPEFEAKMQQKDPNWSYKALSDQWQKQGIFRNLLDDESGSLRVDEDEFDDPDEEALYSAIKNAIPISAEQRSLHRQARAERAGKIDKIQQEHLGEKGLNAQLKALKGKLPKADYESIRGEFTQNQVDRLLNKINMADALMPLEKVKAQVALRNLLGTDGANFSKVPTAGEIKLLSQVFHPKLINALMDDRNIWAKVGRQVISGINLPRALMSSMDVSAPFRQGINFIGKKEFWKAIPEMLKVFGSEENSKALMASIRARPTWELMKKANLAIMDPHSHFLADREEPFQTDWAESKLAKAMLVGHGVAASNRAYHGFLNKLRADVFDDLLRKYEAAGINLATDTKKLREVARFINAATGRGDMGKTLNAAAPALAAGLFSPRLIASRVYMLSPHIYIKKDPILRKEAWKSLFSFGAVALSVAALAKYGLGMDVEMDPRSSDFMKPKIGNTRYDIMGGYQQYITYAARFITNSTKNSKGEIVEFAPDKPFVDNRGTLTAKFVRNKFSPVNSLLWDWMLGKDPVGNDFKVTDAVKNRLIPMGTQDIVDAYDEWGSEGLVMGLPSLVGVGVQTYDPAERAEERAEKKEQKKAAKAQLKEDLNGFEDDGSSFNIEEWDF